MSGLAEDRRRKRQPIDLEPRHGEIDRELWHGEASGLSLLHKSPDPEPVRSRRHTVQGGSQNGIVKLPNGLWIVTERAVATESGEPVDPVQAALWGFGRTTINEEPALRVAVKREGFLTRDSRVVERKKYGRAKARRSFQFSKR